MHITELYKIYQQHNSIVTDTRKLQQGDMFFALKGPNFNANNMAQQAVDAGASFAVIDDAQFAIENKTLLVEDVLQTLQALATHHRKQFTCPFIAITGSNGKTTTKELLYAVLSTTYKTYCTAGNFNNHIGVPLTLLSIKPDAEMAIIEMGANHLQEIASYCQWALPTHVLINNCGKAHLEGFGGLEGVRKGKGELYDFAAANNAQVFLNNDLDYLVSMAQERNIKNAITYGSTNANYNGMVATNAETIDVAILNSGLETLIKTNLVGSYNFANVMAAVAVGQTFKIDIDTIKKAIETYSPTNSRSQLIKQGTNTIILDAYNANPTSMIAAIDNFVRTDYANKVLMLGGMWELGADSLQEHQEIVNHINKTNWNAVVLVGGDFAKVQHNFIYFNASIEAQAWLQNEAFTNCAILIKGSRASAMEKVLG
jgi:UDP-N-acetylmuramoyl-tripeptide--D-alanyl-D-alanine ligase